MAPIPDSKAALVFPRALSLWVRLVLILVGSGMVVLVFPPFRLWYLAPLAWIPLLLAVQGTSARVGFRLGLLGALLSFGGTLIWMKEIFGWPAVLLWFLLAFFVGLFGGWLGSRPPSQHSRLWFAPLTALMWTGIEFYRSEWFVLRFPWITPGTGLPPNLLTPYVGVHGLTFLLILGGTWLALGHRSQQLVGGSLLILLPALSLLTEQSHPTPEGPSIQVALIQREDATFSDYYNLTEEIPEVVDAVVWPEYALHYDIREDPAEMAQLRQLIGTRTSILVLGSQSFRPDGKRFNTAFTIGENGTVLGEHHKNRPVHLFNDGEPGDTLDSFETPIGRLATPVCFDCDYSEVVRKLIQNGAEVLLVPTMDAVSWTARQHEQHSQLFRHRAAENHRWVAVAASSGVTQIIAPNGQVTARLEGMDPGILLGEVGRSDNLTFYTRFGWILGPVCTIAAGLILIASIIHWICFGGGLRPSKKRIPL